jgi:hypothetical protein
MEAFTLGFAVAFFDNVIVMQALCVDPIFLIMRLGSNTTRRLITLGVFLGLTLFTFQSKVGVLVTSVVTRTDVCVYSMTSLDLDLGFLVS